MAGKRPGTIAEYIQAAPAEGQPMLRRLHALLKRVAPDAQETIKWGNPFFVEPRFVFAFSAHKHHLSFMPYRATLDKFAKELAGHETTQHMLKVRYDQALPEALIRKLAGASLKQVSERQGDTFW